MSLVSQEFGFEFSPEALLVEIQGRIQDTQNRLDEFESQLLVVPEAEFGPETCRLNAINRRVCQRSFLNQREIQQTIESNRNIQGQITSVQNQLNSLIKEAELFSTEILIRPLITQIPQLQQITTQNNTLRNALIVGGVLLLII